MKKGSFIVHPKQGEDVVTLRREEVVALIDMVDEKEVDEDTILSAREKLAGKIPERLRPSSPEESSGRDR